MAIAKRTRPTVQGRLPRTRLFRLMDRGLKRPVIRVWEPPAAGQTTSVASYLAAPKLAYLWYQVEGSDADLDSFCHYRCLAEAQAAPHQRQASPLLTPEDFSDLPTFTRRSLGNLYGYLKIPRRVRFPAKVSASGCGNTTKRLKRSKAASRTREQHL